MVFLAQLLAVSEHVPIAGAKLGCRDRDDKILETALTGEANRLVTGDRELLEMSPFCGIPIVAPRDSPGSRAWTPSPQAAAPTGGGPSAVHDGGPYRREGGNGRTDD